MVALREVLRSSGITLPRAITDFQPNEMRPVLLPNFTNVHPADEFVCPGEGHTDERLVSLIAHSIRIFDQSLGERALRGDNELFEVLYPAEIVQAHLQSFASGIRDIMGVSPKKTQVGFALYGAYNLAKQVGAVAPDYSSLLHPLDVSETAGAETGFANIRNIPEAFLTSPIAVFSDDLFHRGILAASILERRFLALGMAQEADQLNSLIRRLEVKKDVLSTEAVAEITELVLLLQKGKMVLASPYIKNTTLKEILMGQAESGGADQPWGSMQAIACQSMVELDEMKWTGGAEMLDVGISPTSLDIDQKYLQQLIAMGFYNIRSLRLGSGFITFVHLHPDTPARYKQMFETELNEALSKLGQDLN